jgi:hypothetical protein
MGCLNYVQVSGLVLMMVIVVEIVAEGENLHTALENVSKYSTSGPRLQSQRVEKSRPSL